LVQEQEISPEKLSKILDQDHLAAKEYLKQTYPPAFYETLKDMPNVPAKTVQDWAKRLAEDEGLTPFINFNKMLVHYGGFNVSLHGGRLTKGTTQLPPYNLYFDNMINNEYAGIDINEQSLRLGVGNTITGSRFS
jgi:hypothetical protein